MTIRVRKSDFCEGPFSFELYERDGRPHVEIGFGPFDPNGMTPQAQGLIRSQLSELLATILARVFVFPDFEQSLKKLFGDDRAMERAIAFTSSFVVLGNVLGKVPRTDISRWRDSKAREYTLKRSKVWDADHPIVDVPEKEAKLHRSEPEKTGSDQHISEQIRLGRVMHSDIEHVSPIRETLWNEAGWSGNAFMWLPDQPPVLAALFKNAAAAAQIFSARADNP